MKVLDFLKQHREILANLLRAGVEARSLESVELVERFIELRRAGNKYRYAVAVVASEHKRSERSVERAIRRLIVEMPTKQ